MTSQLKNALPTPLGATGTATPSAGKAPRTRSGGPRRGESTAGLLMMLPATLGLLAFIAVPFVTAIVLSLFNAHLNQHRAPNFVGLTYYERLFTDPSVSEPFLRSLLNNFVFAVVVIPVQTGLALFLATLLNQKLRGMAIFRTFFFVPVVFPMALVAIIWRLIFDRSDNGLVNAAARFFTAGALPAQDWLGSSATALGAVIVLSIWQGVGFQMIILLAALQEIPQERYEAAELDRANLWQRFRYVTVPGIRNTLIFVTLLTTIYAFRVYDQVYILIRSAGGNKDALQTVLYQATSAVFDRDNLGLACAISVVFFVIVLAITLLQRRLVQQRSDG